MQQPLAGLNVVVTRPREQARDLAHRITQAGGRATLFPLLEISPALDLQPLHALVAHLHEFNLAVFKFRDVLETDKNAAVATTLSEHRR